jgi:hypothetical protein
MSLWLPCGLHGFAVPNNVTVLCNFGTAGLLGRIGEEGWGEKGKGR